MTTDSLTRRRADVVAIITNNVTRQERDEFKGACARNSVTMKDAMYELVKRFSVGDIALTGEFLADAETD